jgi:hypothetical protein
MPRNVFTRHSVALTAIHHRTVSILKYTLQNSGRRHRHSEILENNNVVLEIKAMSRLGTTLVSLIIMSDGTYLSNFPGDKKEWPVYMKMGNLSLTICQMPST